MAYESSNLEILEKKRQARKAFQPVVGVQPVVGLITAPLPVHYSKGSYMFHVMRYDLVRGIRNIVPCRRILILLG
jgi:hypothetical protein